MIILEMVINMDEAPRRTIQQIKVFLAGRVLVEFTAAGDGSERDALISRP